MPYLLFELWQAILSPFSTLFLCPVFGDHYKIEIPAEGLSYIETTIKSHLHNENQTRLFDLYIDSSEEQTRKVLMSKAQIINKSEVERNNRIFQVLQLLLTPYPVHIPFAKKLSEVFPVRKVRARRDFPRFLALIQASTLLHQYQREKTSIYSQEYLIANNEDYRIAYDIAQVVLAQTLKELTPMEERLLKLIEEDFPIEEFSPKDLMKVLENESENTARKCLRDLYKKGFLGWNGERNKNSCYYFIKTIDTGLSLPSPEEIKKYYVHTGDTQIPENAQMHAGTEKDLGKAELLKKYSNTQKSQDSGLDAISDDILSPEGILI